MVTGFDATLQEYLTTVQIFLFIFSAAIILAGAVFVVIVMRIHNLSRERRIYGALLGVAASILGCGGFLLAASIGAQAIGRIELAIAATVIMMIGSMLSIFVAGVHIIRTMQGRFL